MSRLAIRPTGVERSFSDDEIIVSKTDPRGKLTYVNEVFVRVSGYEASELIGAPHSIIRHPEMPRCVFHLLWETILGGREIFAYVVNLCKTGEHYWVYAHVTPSWSAAGELVGFHSNRRTADRGAVSRIAPLYRELLGVESRRDRADAVAAGAAALRDTLNQRGQSYDEFVWSV